MYLMGSMERVVGVFLIVVTLLSFSTSTAGGLPGTLYVTVSCVLRESCTLLCRFSDNITKLFWINGMDPVPIMYYPEDLESYQRPHYKDSASLSVEQIPRGDCSLTLREVKMNHTGKYRCSATSSRGNTTDILLQLTVYTRISKVHLEQVGEELVCRSEGIYPEPNVTWSPSAGTEPKTSVNKTEQGLYSISSSVRLSDNSAQEEFSCNISTNYSSGTNTIKPKQNDPSLANNSLYYLFLVPVLVLLVLLGILMWCCCKRNKKENQQAENASDSQNGANGNVNRQTDEENPFVPENNDHQQNVLQNSNEVQLEEMIALKTETLTGNGQLNGVSETTV